MALFVFLALLSGITHWYGYNHELNLWFPLVLNTVLIGIAILTTINLVKSSQKNNCHQAELVLKNLPVALLVTDNMGYVIGMNALAGELCRIEAGSKSLQITSLKADVDTPVYDLIKTLEGQTAIGNNFSYYQQEDQRYFYKTTLLLDEDSNKKGAILVAWKSTEGLLVEKYLSQREKMAMIGELAAGIAHEVRNPLTSVKGLVQVIAQRFSKDDPAREYTKVILSEIESVNHIIREMLLLARRSSPNLSFASLPAMLDHVLRLVEGETAFREINIVREYDDNFPLVVVDEDQMRQVFLHLVTNAIISMPKGGQLEVSAKYDESTGTVETIIKDEGTGISQENLSRIFHPFFTTRPEGTGLGLPVSLQIVDNHGGKLSVKSTLGVGSEFTVKLPMVNYNKKESA